METMLCSLWKSGMWPLYYLRHCFLAWCFHFGIAHKKSKYFLGRGCLCSYPITGWFFSFIIHPLSHKCSQNTDTHVQNYTWKDMQISLQILHERCKHALPMQLGTYKAKNLHAVLHAHTHAVSYLGLVIKKHHYLAMAVMRSTHLFSTAVPNHKLSPFTLGPEALEVMTTQCHKSPAENPVTTETCLIRIC